MQEKIQLTAQQQEALNQIKEFLQDEEKDVFILKGYAGTGKTTLIKHILKEIENLNAFHLSEGYPRPKFITKVAAPTGRAVKVLEDKLKLTKKVVSFLLTGNPTFADMLVDPIRIENFYNSFLYTVHGHIYEPLNINFDPNKINMTNDDLFTVVIEDSMKNYKVFVPEEIQKKIQIDKNNYKLVFGIKVFYDKTVFIIDEASMISDVAKDDDNSFAIFGTGQLLKDLFTAFPKGKFIFVGDNAQLPPVGSEYIRALDAVYLQEKYNKKVLEYELSQVVRKYKDNDIIKAVSFMRIQTQTKPPHIRNFYIKGLRNILILPLENQLALYIQHLKDYIDKYGKNEGLFQALKENIMIAYKNATVHALNKKIRNNIWNNPNEKLIPGDILMVTQNNPITQLNNGDLVQVIEIGAGDRKYGLNFKEVKLKNLTDGRTVIANIIEDIIDSGYSNISQVQYKKMMQQFIISLHKKYNLNEKPKEKNKIILENMQKDPYINALRAIHGYVITCHKAQGGEWERVFVKLESILSWHKIQKPYNWLYTAFTRSKNQIVVNHFHTIRSFKAIQSYFCEAFPELCDDD